MMFVFWNTPTTVSALLGVSVAKTKIKIALICDLPVRDAVRGKTLETQTPYVGES
jgi:hypothetical protein